MNGANRNTVVAEGRGNLPTNVPCACEELDPTRMDGLTRACIRFWCKCRTRIRELRQSESGQGTTEYAILVGVLVVIAILAIVAFRPKLQELWNAIAEGIGSL